MHGTEDYPMLDYAQQFFIRFQKEAKLVKVRRRNSEGGGGWTVAQAGLAMAGCAVVQIEGFAAGQIRRQILCGNRQRIQKKTQASDESKCSGYPIHCSPFFLSQLRGL